MTKINGDLSLLPALGFRCLLYVLSAADSLPRPSCTTLLSGSCCPVRCRCRRESEQVDSVLSQACGRVALPVLSALVLMHGTVPRPLSELLRPPGCCICEAITPLHASSRPRSQEALLEHRTQELA